MNRCAIVTYIIFFLISLSRPNETKTIQFLAAIGLKAGEIAIFARTFNIALVSRPLGHRQANISLPQFFI
jgi:hypothetical protein